MNPLSNRRIAAVSFAIALGLAAGLPGCGGDKKAAVVHASAGGPGSVTVKQSTAREAIETYCLARANLDTDALGAIVAPDCRKPVVELMNSFKQQLAKQRELADLAEAKFGKDLADSIRDELKDLNKDDRDLIDNDKVVWAKIDLKEESGKATATLVGQNNPVRLALVNDKWYVLVPECENGSADKIKAEADRQTRAAADRLTRADDLIAKVRAGQLNRQQFQDAINHL